MTMRISCIYIYIYVCICVRACVNVQPYLRVHQHIYESLAEQVRSPGLSTTGLPEPEMMFEDEPSGLRVWDPGVIFGIYRGYVLFHYPYIALILYP